MIALSSGKSTGTILRSFSSEGVIIHTAEYSAEECHFGMHYHENPHLCFLLQGEDTECRKHSSYTRKTGDIHFYHAGEEHSSLSRTATTKNTLVEFEQTFLKEYGISEMQIEHAAQSCLDAKFLLLKMQKELLIADTCSSASIQALLLEFISYSVELSAKTAPLWARRVDELLRDKWNVPVSLDELSLAVGVHPVTISKHFRKYFACTLGEYLRKLKVEKSIILVKNSRLPLTEIAYQCGFADQSHFTKVFKETTGFLPKEFRNC
jgi:AraC family transcriptional regulator